LNTYYESYNDITSIDTNTIAVSTLTRIQIVNIDTKLIIQNIKNNKLCYGITHCDGKLYYCHEREGIQRFDFKTKFSSLLVPTKDVGRFSYISSDGSKLFYTSNTETVSCCDMNGKPIWRFKDTSLLRSPRGVVVDNQGFVYVAGENSGNIVVISPDGNSSKEVYQISSPRAMCYDKNENKILVCHSLHKASWLQISLDL
jgi:DNA-binding beta-propeller fold protein YncE